jgi:hypothetical protein
MLRGSMFGLEDPTLTSSKTLHSFVPRASKPHIHFSFLKIQKGMSSARFDDTKSLKGSILKWIIPHRQS